MTKATLHLILFLLAAMLPGSVLAGETRADLAVSSERLNLLTSLNKATERGDLEYVRLLFSDELSDPYRAVRKQLALKDLDRIHELPLTDAVGAVLAGWMALLIDEALNQNANDAWLETLYILSSNYDWLAEQDAAHAKQLKRLVRMAHYDRGLDALTTMLETERKTLVRIAKAGATVQLPVSETTSPSEASSPTRSTH